jgi:hypothetical protein
VAVTSNQTVTATFSGDFQASIPFSAAANAASPGMIQLFTLSSGNNTITLPTGGSTVKAALIIPPSGNTLDLILKGVGGDTGITVSKTDPTLVSFGTPPPANFVLNASGTVTGLRIVWC